MYSTVMVFSAFAWVGKLFISPRSSKKMRGSDPSLFAVAQRTHEIDAVGLFSSARVGLPCCADAHAALGDDRCSGERRPASAKRAPISIVRQAVLRSVPCVLLLLQLSSFDHFSSHHYDRHPPSFRGFSSNFHRADVPSAQCRAAHGLRRLWQEGAREGGCKGW